MTYSKTRKHRVDRALRFFSPAVVRIGTPPPLTRRRVCPPFGSGGRHNRWGGEGGGGGGSQFGRGDRHCGTLGKYVLCARQQYVL
jgi:hypothetical protein